MVNKETRRVLIALGGNALEPEQGDPTAAGQLKTIQSAAAHIAGIIKAGNQVLITHGNGPQVGRILLQSEAGKDLTPEIPLDSAGAMTQGAIGYHIQNAVVSELKKLGIEKKAVSLVTQVQVDEKDPAFQAPTKPIGPFYSKEEADKLAKEKNQQFVEDSGRGYRRVVASPKPLAVVEADSARILLDAGVVVIVAGGGGIPVVDKGGQLVGVEAVIDKDLSSSLLAEQLDVDDLFILTAVPKIALNYGQPNQLFLDKLTITEAEEYIKEEHFAPGSMLPKVEAAINFVRNNPHRRSIITSLESAVEALEGKDGTTIVQ